MADESLKKHRKLGAAKRAIAPSFRERPTGRAKNLMHWQGVVLDRDHAVQAGRVIVKRFLACGFGMTGIEATGGLRTTGK